MKFVSKALLRYLIRNLRTDVIVWSDELEKATTTRDRERATAILADTKQRLTIAERRLAALKEKR